MAKTVSNNLENWYMCQPDIPGRHFLEFTVWINEHIKTVE